MKFHYDTASTASHPIRHERGYLRPGYICMFQCFRKEVLQRADLSVVPRPMDVERFLWELPRYLGSRHPTAVPSLNNVSKLFTNLLYVLQFHWEDWTVEPYWKARFAELRSTLLGDGFVTNDPIREKQRINSRVVFALNRATISDALVDGCRTWDGVVQGCLAIAFQAALCGRAGDITRSTDSRAHQCLHWQDAKFVISGDFDDPQFAMSVTLLYRKGLKDDQSCLPSWKSRLSIRMSSAPWM